MESCCKFLNNKIKLNRNLNREDQFNVEHFATLEFKYSIEMFRHVCYVKVYK